MTHIFDQLATTKLSAGTCSQLNTGADMTFIDVESVDYWKGIATVWRAIEASRTYPQGLPIPEASVLDSETIAASGYFDFQPTGTEIWRVVSIGVTAAAGTPGVNVFFSDGSTSSLMHSGTSSTSASSFFPFEAPFDITNTGYLRITNGDASNAITCVIGYHKVGL
jgi:hypothetical protein